MTNRMLINAAHAEEVRVAIVNGSRLDDLDIEVLGKEQQKANIYKGKITRIEPSLEAVFVDYGAERHGFLPFREIAEQYLKDSDTDLPFKEQIEVGQEIIIQVEKEIRGNKGAALTTFISMAGCYLVLMPNNPSAGGISRRIDPENRAELKEIIRQLEVPETMGVIVRTAGEGRAIEDLKWDMSVLLQQWNSICEAAETNTAPFLIYQESSLLVRAIRDHLKPEIDEILIDSKKVYDDACMHVKMMRPDYASRVKLYEDSIPLFNRFQIESQIVQAFQRTVPLPSGGAIVIDHTEALISIDINSAKATGGGDIEDTARQTNLEAADEIARQLRLRDVGGLIVIDFIDMLVSQNQRAVEQRLRTALSIDRARVQVGKISQRFGLLEMSRQRLRPALSDARDIPCPRCLGQGMVRTAAAFALSMLRLIEEDALKENTVRVIADLPVEVATYLINEKRTAITDLETRHGVQVVILPNKNIESPNYLIKRIKKDESVAEKSHPSYALTSNNESAREQYEQEGNTSRAAPAVTSASLAAPAHTSPPSDNNNKPGIIKRLWSSIVGDEEEEKPKPTTKKYKHSSRASTRRPHHKRRTAPKQKGSRNNNTSKPNNNGESNNTPNAKQKRSPNKRRRGNRRVNNPNQHKNTEVKNEVD